MRSNILDLLKAISAFLVVCIYIKFPGKFGEYVNIFAAIAVPIFFMITGYYWQKMYKNNKINFQIKKIIKLLLGTIIIYISYAGLIRLLKHDDIIEYFIAIFSLKNIIKFLLFNEIQSIGHIWYLGSILYIMILAKYLLNKEKIKKTMKYLLPIAFIIYIIIGKYSKLIFGYEFPYYYLRRNFIFVGIPYFYIGYLINENISKIKLSNKSLTIISICLVLGTLIEKFILDRLNMNVLASNYICISILPIIIFELAIKNSQVSFGNLLPNIGKNYSTIIYIIHPLIIAILGNIVEYMGIYQYYEWVAPFIVYIISLLVAIAMKKIMERVKEK